CSVRRVAEHIQSPQSTEGNKGNQDELVRISISLFPLRASVQNLSLTFSEVKWSGLTSAATSRFNLQIRTSPWPPRVLPKLSFPAECERIPRGCSTRRE